MVNFLYLVIYITLNNNINLFDGNNASHINYSYFVVSHIFVFYTMLLGVVDIMALASYLSKF